MAAIRSYGHLIYEIVELVSPEFFGTGAAVCANSYGYRMKHLIQ